MVRPGMKLVASEKRLPCDKLPVALAIESEASLATPDIVAHILVCRKQVPEHPMRPVLKHFASCFLSSRQKYDRWPLILHTQTRELPNIYCKT